MAPTSWLRILRAGLARALAKVAVALWVLAVLAGCGKDGQRTYSPTAPQSPPPPPVESVGSQLIGLWSGSTSVTMREGVEPDCLPRYLQRGSTDDLAAEIFTQGGPDLLLHLEQKSIGGGCYFNLSADATSVHATPYGSDAWGYDGCQVKLDSSSWGCRPPVPDVSILGIAFEGTFTDSSATQIRGTLQLRYQHRAGEITPYASFAVTEAFTLAQVAK